MSLPYLYYIDFENIFALNNYVREMSEQMNQMVSELVDMVDESDELGESVEYKHDEPHRIRVPTKEWFISNRISGYLILDLNLLKYKNMNKFGRYALLNVNGVVVGWKIR